MKRLFCIPLVLGLSMVNSARADQVILDDLIVQGSTCTGFDCVNNEIFGLDSLRLKENNLRIKFEDISPAPLPGNDWQITANDSASGGANQFSIEDISAAQVPFKLIAGARSNSLLISPTGAIGLGSAAPVLNLHILKSDTPAMRLEQDASASATPQTWDVAGNEANFFVRDVTSGSRLPLRIRPGARHNSLVLAGNGAIGVGTPLPQAQMHLFGSAGDTQLKVEETSGTTAARTLLEIANLGEIVSRFDAANSHWLQQIAASNYRLTTGSSSLPRLTLSDSGNLAIPGSLSQGSSRSLKQDIVPLDIGGSSAKVLDLPLFDWRYIEDVAAGRGKDSHIGPMAEDFHARFATGADPQRLAPGDVAAVALVAVKDLDRQLAEKDAQLVALLDRLDRLERHLKSVERAQP